jgi:hypothetical protein
MQVQGVVEKEVTRPMAPKPGQQPYNAYDIFIGGVKYGCGFKPTGANAGDNVSFDATQNEGGYWNLTRGTGVLVGTSAPVQNQAVAPTMPVTQASVQKSVSDTQIAIQLQSSRKDAIEMVKILAQTSSIGISDKTAVSKRAPIIEALVDDYTSSFYNRIGEVVANGGVGEAVPKEGNFDDDVNF